MHGANQPRLLLAKKRRALGSKDAKAENAAEEYIVSDKESEMLHTAPLLY
jgi:hypothetical protein